MPTPSAVFNRTKDNAESINAFLSNPTECKTKELARGHLQRQLFASHIEGLDHAIELFNKYTTKSHIRDCIIAERAELAELMRTL